MNNFNNSDLDLATQSLTAAATGLEALNLMESTNRLTTAITSLAAVATSLGTAGQIAVKDSLEDFIDSLSTLSHNLVDAINIQSSLTALNLKGVVQGLKASVVALTAADDSLGSDNMNVAKAKDFLIDAKNALTGAAETLTALNLIGVATSLDGTNNDLKTTKGDLDLSVGSLDGIKTSLGSSVGSLDTTKDALNLSVGSLDGIKTSLGSSVGSLDTTKDALGRSVEALGSSVEALDTTKDALGSSVEALGITKDALSSSVEALGTTKEALGSNVEALGITKDALGSSVEALGITKDALGSSVEALDTTKEALGSNVEALGSSVEALDITKASLGSSVEALGTTKEALGSNVEALGSSVADLKVAVGNLKSSYTYTPIQSMTNNAANNILSTSLKVKNVLSGKFDVLKYLLPTTNIGDICKNALCSDGLSQINTGFTNVINNIKQATSSSILTKTFQDNIGSLNIYYKSVVQFQLNNALHSTYVDLVNNEITLINKIVSNTPSSTTDFNPTKVMTIMTSSSLACDKFIINELSSIRQILKQTTEIDRVISALSNKTPPSGAINALNDLLKAVPCTASTCSALYAEQIDGTIDNINVCIAGYGDSI